MMYADSLFARYRDEVRTRLSLRELVEACEPERLRRTGRSGILCASPLRVDRHGASFSVFENGAGEYLAFDHATKESFDLFSFVMAKEGLDFAGAVRWCGERAGLTWETYRAEHGGGGAPQKPDGFTDAEWDRALGEVVELDERELVARAQQAMVDLCHGWFIRWPKLVRYVEERWGIGEETQQRFLLGYVPYGFAGVLGDLHARGEFPYARAQLAKTGWFHEVARLAGDPEPELRCLFDGRLVYPYMLRGKCRYAVARTIFEDGIEPAYLESHPWEQAKFKKALVGGGAHPHVSPHVQNDLLYNADNAGRSRTGFARIVVVEGPSDCMAMVEAGYDCVAPVTTSVRAEDLPMLCAAVARYPEVVLATDTDVKPDGRRPGFEGALRMAPALLAAGKRVRVLVFPLPPGESKVDPASYARAWKRAGRAGDPFAELVAAAPTVAGALAALLDPETTAAQLPEALSPIVKFARDGRSTRAEVEEVARVVRDRLGGRFSLRAVQQAMGEAAERDAAPPEVEPDTLPIEGRVVERGGHDQPGQVRCYQASKRDGSPTVVSTFLLQPERVVVTAAGDRLLEVSVHTETGTRLIDRWVVPKRAWTSRRDFVSSFPHERMQFTGSDNNVHAVYQIVSERAARLGVRTVRGEGVVGLHRTAAGLRLVLPQETWDAGGVMADPDVVYSPESGPVPFCAMLRADGAQDPAAVDPLVARLLGLLFELGDPVPLTTISAWLVGCFFLPEIREHNGGKASILNVYGSPGSGKTTLLHQVLCKTLQPFAPHFEPASPGETKFATVRNLSWSNCLVSAFDEYRSAEAGADFMRLLRAGFSGSSEMRGSRDQSVRGYSLMGAVALSGEQRADVDAAMSERLVMVGLDRGAIESRGEAGAAAVRAVLATDDRWRVASDILRWRMRLEPAEVRRWWSEARAASDASLARMALQVAPRTRDLCAELAFRLRAWDAWLDHRPERRVEVPRPGLDAVLRGALEGVTGVPLPQGGGVVVTVQSRSLVVRALEAATPYAVSGLFAERSGYRLATRQGRLVLVVHPGSLAACLARESRARGQPDPTNGELALKRAAREEHERGGDLGWLLDPQFPYRMGSGDDVGGESSKSARLRCWLVDVERAHERVGLELDWPGTVATWGGDRRDVPVLPGWRRVPPADDV